MAQRLRENGISNAEYTTTGTLSQIISTLDKGQPVPLGVMHSEGTIVELPSGGSSRYPYLRVGDNHYKKFGGSGHWLLVVGYEGDKENPSAFLFNDLLKQSSRLNWYALELDKRPLMHSIKNENFRSLWEPKVNQIFDSLLFNSSFEDNSFSCKLLWGDARNQISKIPININFDLVFLDGFSPQKCPEIWSVEFISNIKTKLKKGGCIITYCSSAAVRKTFIDLGLVIYNILPDTKTKNFWSIGTLALEAINTNEHQINPYIEKLTLMELEHLKTKAAVPYRDPDINSLSLEILQRRNNEQRLSLLADTNKWRKKWNMTKST